MIKNTICLIITFLVVSCAGTIHTIRVPQPYKFEFKKALIISKEDSEFIKFTLPSYEQPAEKSEVMGNTDIVIKQVLENYGIQAVIGKKDDAFGDYDLIVEYHDTWRWDFKKVLDRLEITFVTPEGNFIAKSTYNIYENKELHNFPTPKKEVPKMIKQMLNKKK